MQHSRTLVTRERLAAIAILFVACLAIFGLARPAQAAGESGGDDKPLRARGLVEQMPAEGKIGDWVIGGVTYTADSTTEFDLSEGDLAVGVCAKVAYFDGTTPFVAKEIDSEPLSDCKDDGGEQPDLEAYGRVETIPDGGAAGDWVISGVTYRADAATEFKPEYGPIVAGACVKVHYFDSTTPFSMRELETERDYRCSGGGDDNTPGEAEMYGELKSFPAELIGEWVVGGMTFVADNTTEFDQRNGEFKVGITVKVHFVTKTDGTLLATEIKSKLGNDDGDDDGGDGHHDGAEGQAYGLIETIPADRIGQWVISGISYTATATTEFEDEHGAFEVGARVRVEYRLDSANGRIAKQIKTTDDNGGVEDGNHAKLVGFIVAMPATGFVGDWMVGDVALVGTETSKFKEDHGLFAVGAYVEVEYSVVAGKNVIHEMETQVPPGAGDDDHIGEIENETPGLAAVTATTLRVGGRTYVLTPATVTSRAGGPLVAGQTVLVNSYKAADGTQVATLVRSVNLSQTLFMPMAVR